MSGHRLTIGSGPAPDKGRPVAATRSLRVLIVAAPGGEAGALTRLLAGAGPEIHLATARGHGDGLRRSALATGPAPEPSPDVVIVCDPLGDRPAADFLRAMAAAPGPHPAALIWTEADAEEAEALVAEAEADGWLGPQELAAPAAWPLVRKALHAALRNRELRSRPMRDARTLQEIARAASSWFWETDAAHRFTDFPDGGRPGLAELSQTIRGRTRWEVAGGDPQRDPHWRRHLETLEARQTLDGFTYQIPLLSGTRWLRISGAPLFDAEGRFQGYRGLATDITAEMEAHAQADLARARLTDAIENLPAAVALYDAGNRLVFCNEAARRLSAELSVPLEAGMAFESILEMAAGAGSVTAQDESRLRNMCKGLRDLPGRGASMERRLADGRWLLLSTHATARGEVISIQFDITARKQAEQALREREARLQSILQNLAEAVLVVDASGRVASLNLAAERMFGWSEADIVGQSVALLLPESGMLRDEGARRSLLRARLPAFLRPSERPHAGRRRDGTTFPLELSVASIGRHDERIFIVIARDLSAREALEAERHRLALAVEHSPAGILITKANGNIEYANPRFCEVTGWTLPEILGKTPRILNSGLTPKEVHADLWQTILSGQIWHGRLRNRRKSGELYWTENHIAPIRNAAGRISHFVAIEEDVTEATAREEELMRAKEEAELANRTKSEFLANVSHELRTPLNAIIGFSQLLAQEAFGPIGSSRYRDYSADILRSGHHLLGLIDEILDISRIELGKTSLSETVFDPMEQIEACARMVMPRLQEGKVELHLDLAPDLPRLRGDQLRFRQIVLNLLSNSAKFTPTDGRVAIHAAQVAPDGSGQADGLEIQVADTGIGMSEHEIARALIPFAQVESPMTRRHGGAGLGLTIAVALIAQHQGSLSIDSTPGRGTTVTVRFPASRLVAGSASES